MNDSLRNSSETLRKKCTDFLWKEWSELGVGGHAERTGRAIIDPEALLLFSTIFARFDARLFDEIVDWLKLNGSWINLIRLGRMQAEFRLGDGRVLGAIAEHLSQESAHLKWKALAKRPQSVGSGELLFPHLPQPGSPEYIFQCWGLIRGKMEPRRLTKPPRMNKPGTFLLQLRALFGRQARAEVLAWLLSHPAGHPAQIAKKTGYFRGSVQNVLNELELSGHVLASRSGREKVFQASRQTWRFLLTWDRDGTAEYPQWVPWAPLFSVVQRLDELLILGASANYSEDVWQIEFDRRMSPLFAQLIGEEPQINGFTEPAVLRSRTAFLEQLIGTLSAL